MRQYNVEGRPSASTHTFWCTLMTLYQNYLVFALTVSRFNTSNKAVETAMLLLLNGTEKCRNGCMSLELRETPDSRPSERAQGQPHLPIMRY